MSVKKLAIIRGSYRPDGGAERIIARMIQGLKQHVNLDITLITKKWSSPEGTPNIHLQIIPAKGWFRHTKLIHFNQHVQHYLDENTYDIIQSHERVPGCQIYRAGDGVHKQWLEIRKKDQPPFRQWLWNISPFHKTVLAAERATFYHPNLKAIICNSHQIKQDILRHYPQTPQSKIKVIYNGIDLDKYSFINRTEQISARNALGLSEHDYVLLFVGSGFYRKGLKTLLEALTLTKKWKLLVVGKDKQRHSYEQYCNRNGLQERVTFAGMQTDVKKYYAACDLLVHPALYDPAPNVILEAMACGRGVLVSKSSGNSEIIDQTVEGYIHETGNHHELAGQLNQLSDRSLYQQLGRHARKTAENFSSIKMNDQLIELYQSIL